MNRKRFTYLCLILSVVGLGVLQFSTSVLRPETVDIEEVTVQDVGETVRVRGRVSGMFSTDSAAFFTLVGSTGEVSVVSFDSSDIGNGQKVVVLGRVELRDGELQIVSTEIEQS